MSTASFEIAEQKEDISWTKSRYKAALYGDSIKDCDLAEANEERFASVEDPHQARIYLSLRDRNKQNYILHANAQDHEISFENSQDRSGPLIYPISATFASCLTAFALGLFGVLIFFSGVPPKQGLIAISLVGLAASAEFGVVAILRRRNHSLIDHEASEK